MTPDSLTCLVVYRQPHGHPSDLLTTRHPPLTTRMIRPAIHLSRKEWQALDDALDTCAMIDADAGAPGPDFRGLRNRIRAALANGERVILCPDALGFISRRKTKC